MWTPKTRGRMAEIRKKLKRYPTDMTEEEWSVIAPLLPPPAKRGRPRKTNLREVVNAIRYLVRTGCGWEMLPSDFPPWQTVYWWFRRFVRRLLFNTIHDIALMADRERAGREARPSAGITDSAGAQLILDAIRKRWPWVKHLFADGAYDRAQLMDKAAFLNFVIEIVRRIEGTEGFHVLPRRWVVERTFGWMTRWRRLVRDYEQRIDVSDAMIHIALGALLIRRIAH